MKHIAIIGGGPIGVEAALYGACAGFDVRLYERGRIAENVRQWGHIRFFTEWKRNRSPLACRLLAEQGFALHDENSTSTGEELADYVLRLTALEPLRGRISPQTEVISLTRERCLKSDFINDVRRADFPFRLVVRGAFGEKVRHADAVLDASGVYATPNWAGSGGAPCVGELENQRRIDYRLPDVAGRDRARFANRHTLVVGSGHSAAGTLLALDSLLEAYPQTRITWVVRRDVPPHGYPYTLVENDPSPNRDALHRRANELTEHPNVDFHPRTVVDAIAHNGKNFRVTLSTWVPRREVPAALRLESASHDAPLADCESHSFQVECDNIAAHTGFGPDPTLWADLQVHVHPATGGPYNLAEVLIANNELSGVGLSTGYAEKRARPQAAPAPQGEPQAEPGGEAEGEPDGEVAAPPVKDRWQVVVGDPRLLQHPEPYFYVLGIKSYGRDAGFLMQNGFRQVRDAYKLLSGNPELDLYEGALD